jgi:hypothetical protein
MPTAITLPATAARGSTPAGAPSTAPKAPPTTAPHSNPPPSRSATATAKAKTSTPGTLGTPRKTAVIGLTVIEFSYFNADRVDDLVIVEVHTSGPGRVVLSLLASAESRRPARSSRSLQGSTSYLVVSLLPGGRGCFDQNRAVTASTVPRAAATQYTQLSFPMC